MEIEQQVSSPGTRESGDIAPPINETRANTHLITKDGHPLVIGGLMSTKATTNMEGVPLLKDIPLLGRLFRYNEIQNSRKELVILVLPRIIRNPEQGWNVTDDVLQRRVQQLEQLFNREHTDADKVKQFMRRQFVPDGE
jgi:type II secretory pathway component GspD/PulD (secretin)